MARVTDLVKLAVIAALEYAIGPRIDGEARLVPESWKLAGIVVIRTRLEVVVPP